MGSKRCESPDPRNRAFLLFPTRSGPSPSTTSGPLSRRAIHLQHRRGRRLPAPASSSLLPRRPTARPGGLRHADRRHHPARRRPQLLQFRARREPFTRPGHLRRRTRLERHGKLLPYARPHELTQWTAPAQRCDRDLSGRFGSAAYAMEELVVELGAVNPLRRTRPQQPAAPQICLIPRQRQAARAAIVIQAAAATAQAKANAPALSP